MRVSDQQQNALNKQPLHLLVLSLLLLCCVCLECQAATGAKVVSFYGYDDCIELNNGTTKAVLCPAAGGRILFYGIDDRNILYLPPGNEGWVWDGKSSAAPMHAGRCDVGPEHILPRRNLLWQGRWTGQIIGDRQAVLESQDDPSTGIRLKRTFELSASSSQLKFTQTIINVSSKPIETCHWSRTFAQGKGLCLIPVSQPGRFPQHYVRYDAPSKVINFAADDPNIKLVDDCLLIQDHPLYPKLGFDSHRGWLAYCSPQNLLFVKRFPTYPDRAYNEIAGLTISVWYPADDMVELEPIGPREYLTPGQSSQFTETWYLADFQYPESKVVSTQAIKSKVESLK